MISTFFEWLVELIELITVVCMLLMKLTKDPHISALFWGTSDRDLHDHERGDFVRELPSVFPRPAVKKIVPTGWVELPSRDNPCSQRQASTRVVSCPSPGSADIFEFLGQHSEYFTQHNRLSPSVAQFIGHFHALIPRLRAVEMDLKHIVDQVKSGIITEEQIAHYMSQSEKVEYDRLVLGLAGLRVEMANLLRRMQSNTRATDAGNDRVALQDPPIYDFPFSL
ncbi:hypothetical protein Y032_0764g2153 [Ancylostoma ceylanicum]|uniref:Uncharacterized protein n=1 Tax=Ancylostoma ceylanicum TaxID=53326 RepID=A0A016WDV8_9BILA|nr:hypothetical protein Y032_0764g2153 [Ancylostoma ceylanicum]